MKNFHNCRFSAIKLTVTVCLFAAFFISNDIKAKVLYQDIQDPSEIGVRGLTGISNLREDELGSQDEEGTLQVVGLPRNNVYKSLREIEEGLVTPFQLPEDFGKSKYDYNAKTVADLDNLDNIRARYKHKNLINWLLASGIVIFIFVIVIIVIKYISNKTEKATRESPKSKVIVEKPQIENAPKLNKNDAPKGTEKDSKEKIIEDLQILSNAIQEDNIELAKEKIEQIRNAIKNTNIEEDLAKSIDTIIIKFTQKH